MGLVVRTERIGDITVARVLGEFDLHSSAEVQSTVESLLLEGGGEVFLDLAGVTFVDSSGLGTLVRLQKRANRAHVRMVLCGLGPQLNKLLDITFLREAFTILPEVPSALPLPPQAAEPGGHIWSIDIVGALEERARDAQAADRPTDDVL
jgi:anti-sigma B factor antagonist